jgi:hypothetical protein
MTIEHQKDDKLGVMLLMCRIATPQLNVEESDLYLIGTIFKSSISHFNGSWS